MQGNSTRFGNVAASVAAMTAARQANEASGRRRRAREADEAELNQRIKGLQTRFFGSLNAADVLARLGQLMNQQLDRELARATEHYEAETLPAYKEELAAYQERPWYERAWLSVSNADEKPAVPHQPGRGFKTAVAEADLLAFYPAFQKPHLLRALDYLSKEKLVTIDDARGITPNVRALDQIKTVLNPPREWDNRTRTPLTRD